MVLGLLKWLKEFNQEKEKLFPAGKFILRRKEEFMNFQIKEKLILCISGNKRRIFQRRMLVER